MPNLGTVCGSVLLLFLGIVAYGFLSPGAPLVAERIARRHIRKKHSHLSFEQVYNQKPAVDAEGKSYTNDVQLVESGGFIFDQRKPGVVVKCLHPNCRVWRKDSYTGEWAWRALYLWR